MSRMNALRSHLRRPEQPRRPVLLALRSSTWFITTSVAVAIFTDIFLYAVIVPVIPFAITERCDIQPDRVQYWTTVLVAVYGAATLTASPFTGYFADRTASRRFPLLLGLVVLAGATVMLNIGSSIAVLIAGRVLQGISASIVWTVGLALLCDTAGKHQIGQYMGYVGMAMSLGVLVGPLLGGVVFDRGGYNAVFAMQYALIGVDIIFRFLLVEKRFAVRWLPQPEHDQEAHGVSAATSQVANNPTLEEKGNALCDIADLTSADAKKPSPRIASDGPPETSNRRRLPPVVTLLASRRLLTGLWAVLAVSALMTSFDATLPLFVRHTFNWDSIGAGLVFLPIVVPSFFGPFVGWVSDRYGPRYLATVGFLSACPSLVLLRLVDHNSMSQKVLLCTFLTFIGITLTLIFPPIMSEIFLVVEAKERTAERAGLASPFGKGGAYAQAYGLFNVAWSAGAMIGPFWAGFVNDSAGWGAVGWSLAILSGVSAIPTFIWAGGSIRRNYKRTRANSSGDDGA